MFGWDAFRPGFALPKYHALLGWLGATYWTTTLSIKYLPGITPVVLLPALLASKNTLIYLALHNHQPVGERNPPSDWSQCASRNSSVWILGTYNQTSCLGSILYALCFLMLYLCSFWISNQSHLCCLGLARFVHVVS